METDVAARSCGVVNFLEQKEIVSWVIGHPLAQTELFSSPEPENKVSNFHDLSKRKKKFINRSKIIKNVKRLKKTI